MNSGDNLTALCLWLFPVASGMVLWVELWTKPGAQHNVFGDWACGSHWGSMRSLQWVLIPWVCGLEEGTGRSPPSEDTVRKWPSQTRRQLNLELLERPEIAVAACLSTNVRGYAWKARLWRGTRGQSRGARP